MKTVAADRIVAEADYLAVAEKFPLRRLCSKGEHALAMNVER